jgi:hypothetical protein
MECLPDIVTNGLIHMDEHIPTQIIEAIAEAEGMEPERLDVSLQNCVSTDAIRELVAHQSDSWRLQFETPNHVVHVMGDNTILVDGERQREFA